MDGIAGGGWIGGPAGEGGEVGVAGHGPVDGGGFVVEDEGGGGLVGEGSSLDGDELEDLGLVESGRGEGRSVGFMGGTTGT